MVLREMNLQDEDEIQKMYEEYMDSELIPGIDRFEGIRDLERLGNISFEELYDLLEFNKHEENLPETYSPCNFYLGVNDMDEIVGGISLRWKSVPILETVGGFIGYSVRPTQRGRGYASEMLRLGMEKFQGTHFDEVLITCKDFNIPSKKVIEKNGGIYRDTYHNESDGYDYLRYMIKVKK